MTKNPFIALALLLALYLGGCQDKKTAFEIPEGYVGMFGYGSLMSKSFIETGLLGGHYEGPYLPAHLKGYKRSWSFAWPSEIPSATADGQYYKAAVLVNGDTIYPEYLHYLNIREDASSALNGVLYMVPEADLPVYDAWEPGYERFDATGLIEDYTISGGKVYAYRALPEFVREPGSNLGLNVIERDYLEIIEEAFLFWGPAFEAEYHQSTAPVDGAIVQEVLKIPWENPPLEKVEELMQQFEYNDPR